MPATGSEVVPAAGGRPWLRFYDQDVPADVEVPDQPFADLLDEAADRWPGSPALCHLGRELSYRELRHDVEQLSTSLARLGVGPADPVGLVLPNGPQFVIALFAVLRLGAVAVPLPTTVSAESLTAVLADTGAEVVICLDRAYEHAARARDDPRTSVREIVVTLRTDYLPALDRITLAVPNRAGRRERARASGSVPPGAGVRLWSEELRRARGLPVPAPGRDEVSPSTDPAVILYPATLIGGELVGHVLTSRNLRAAGAQAAAWLTHARPGRESVLVGLPLCTAEGLALCLSAGTMLGAALQLIPQPAPESGPSVSSGVRPSVAVGPPAFLDELLTGEPGETGVDLRSLRLCVTGPGFLEPAHSRRLESMSGAAVVDGLSVPGAPVLLGRPVRGGRYRPDAPGARETPQAPAGSSPEALVGIPLPSTEVRIVDPDGEALPPGRPGRLQARGPQVFSGVWRRPDRTAAVLRGGWLTTDLFGCLHPDGWVELLPG